MYHYIYIPNSKGIVSCAVCTTILLPALSFWLPETQVLALDQICLHLATIRDLNFGDAFELAMGSLKQVLSFNKTGLLHVSL